MVAFKDKLDELNKVRSCTNADAGAMDSNLHAQRTLPQST
jgi:hypothetical protein